MKNFEAMFPNAAKEIERMIEDCRAKYPNDNPVERYESSDQIIGKLFSHISKWFKVGADRDADNNQLHMASVIFWAAVLLEDDVELNEEYQDMMKPKEEVGE